MIFERAAYIEKKLPIQFELKLLLSKRAQIVLFEIGACEGEDSIKYARLFPNATIYAFEPLPDNISLIKNNYSKYGIKNARYFNKALSSENGIAIFYVSAGRPANIIDSDWDYGNKSSSLLPPSKHLETANFINFDKRIEVETITLESFCRQEQISDIDFIHMDVQGAELMVLEGAGDFINSVKAIWLEVSSIQLYKDQPLAKDVQGFMIANGFVLLKDELYGIQGDQLYVSKKYFSGLTIFLFKMAISVRSVLIRLLAKLKKFK